MPAGNGDESGEWTHGASGGARPRVIIDTTDLDNGQTSDLESEIDSMDLFGIALSQSEASDTWLAQIGSSVKDTDGLPYYARGGHHEMPKGVYEKWDLQSETRKVFNGSTTGSLPGQGTGERLDDRLARHIWDGPEGPHGNYNRAVGELSERFMKDRNITPETMTPEQARNLLTEIRISDDPRIRDYNRGIRMLRRVYRLFRGRE